ncbi:Uncharacterised protein [Shigella sonnei]|nr:Uncharacterised protein [Shigella sonnei]
MSPQVVTGKAPAQFIRIDFHAFQLTVADVHALCQGKMAVHCCTIDAATIIFPRIRQCHPLGKIEPCLLTFGDVHQQTSIEQKVIVIYRTTRNGVGRYRLPGSNLLLLRVVDEIIYPVLSILIAYATANGKNIINVIAGLQEGRQIGDVI